MLICIYIHTYIHLYCFTCGELLVTWIRHGNESQHSISVLFYYYIQHDPSHICSGCSSAFMRAAILCRLFSRVSFYLYSIFFSFFSVFTVGMLYVAFLISFLSFMLRCILGRSERDFGLSVWYGSSVVIRWHITLKCLLLFYKINFCEAHMSGQQQQRGKRIITWCQFHLLPLSLTEKKVQRNTKQKKAKNNHNCGMFYYRPSESFRAKLCSWSLDS